MTPVALAKATILVSIILFLAALNMLKGRASQSISQDAWDALDRLGFMGAGHGSKRHNKARMTRSGKTTAQLRVLREKFKREKKK